MSFVIEGPAAPQLVQQTLLVIELRPTTEVAVPRVLGAADSIGSMGAGSGLLVDCPCTDPSMVTRTLAKTLADWSVRLMDPIRSMGATRETGRCLIRVLFPPDAGSRLDRAALINHLLTLHLPKSTLAADDSIVDDAASLLLEVTHPDAAIAVKGMCEEMTFLTSKKLLVRTKAPATSWAECMEELVRIDDTRCALRLRWRPGRLGGRILAQPELTAQQTAAVQREVVRQSLPPATHVPREIVISAPHFAGYDGGALVRIILGFLANRGLPMEQGSDTGPLRDGQWRAAVDSLGIHHTGKVMLAVGNELDAVKVRDLLDERAVNVGQAVITLQVHEDGLARAQTKNGRRGHWASARAPGSK